MWWTGAVVWGWFSVGCYVGGGGLEGGLTSVATMVEQVFVLMLMRGCLERCGYACNLSAICTCMEVAVPVNDMWHGGVAASSLIYSVPRASISTGDAGSREQLFLIISDRIKRT